MKQRNCYEIIIDDGIFNDFIYTFLPELEENQVYYVALFARKKYTPNPIHLGNGDRNQLSRFVVSSKEKMIRKIKRLEIPHDNGGYVTRSGSNITEQALALYVLPNPRDTKKATANLMKKSAEFFLNNSGFNSISSSVISEIHKCPIKSKPFIIFDIDKKDPEDLNYIGEITNHFHKVLETKNGYHIILKKEDIPRFESKYWYNKLKELSDQSGDIMIPIPGCRQGDFSPKFLN